MSAGKQDRIAQEASDGNPAALEVVGIAAIDPAAFAPAFLAATAVILLMMSCWSATGAQEPNAAELAQFTDWGRQFFRPDHDLPIYVVGLAAALGLAFAACSAWRIVLRRHARTGPDKTGTDASPQAISARSPLIGPEPVAVSLGPASEAGAALPPGGKPPMQTPERAHCTARLWRVRLLGYAHVPLALLFALVPLLDPGAAWISAASGAAATLSLPCLWAVAFRIKEGGKSTRRPSGPLALAVSLGGLPQGRVADRTALRAPGRTRPRRPAGIRKEVIGPARAWRPTRKHVRRVVGAAAVALVVLLVYVPDCPHMASRAFLTDAFHHWNFFAMAPALAFRHGKALCTEAYSQYGVGWPMLFAALSHLTPLAYKTLICVGMLWACAYYSVLFFFLQSLTRSAIWPLVGVLLTLLVQLFSGTDVPMWVFPSSTVLRSPVDVPLFFACLGFARRGNARLGTLVGVLAGAALLFNTETGLYLIGSLAFYLALLCRLPSSAAAGHCLKPFAAWAALGAAAVLLPGLAWASRGSLFQPAFWAAWLEPLLTYARGFGALPIQEAIHDRCVYLLFFGILLCYAMGMHRSLDLARQRAVSPRHAIVGTVSLYGLGILLLFINRSEPSNLFHPTVPFVIVLTSIVAEVHARLLRRLGTARPSPAGGACRAVVRYVPVGCLAAVLAGLGANGNVRDYAGLVSRLEGRTSASEAGNEVCMFPATSDVPLARGEYEKEFTPRVKLGERFRSVVDLIRRLDAEGRCSVALIGYCDTNYLVAADLAPYFRYCPTADSMLLWQHVAFILMTLKESPPDYVVVIVPFATDVVPTLQAFLEHHFALDHKDDDVYVYQRTAETIQYHQSRNAHRHVKATPRRLNENYDDWESTSAPLKKADSDTS
jgi:hypothetical protein